MLVLFLGEIEGYERSADVGKLKADGSYENNINNGRTSTNAWCQHDCYTDEIALVVQERLSSMTGINETNSEYLQLLRYEEGQHYQVCQLIHAVSKNIRFVLCELTHHGILFYMV